MSDVIRGIKQSNILVHDEKINIVDINGFLSKNMLGWQLFVGQ